VLTEKQKKT